MYMFIYADACNSEYDVMDVVLLSPLLLVWVWVLLFR